MTGLRRGLRLASLRLSPPAAALAVCVGGCAARESDSSDPVPPAECRRSDAESTSGSATLPITDEFVACGAGVLCDTLDLAERAVFRPRLAPQARCLLESARAGTVGLLQVSREQDTLDVLIADPGTAFVARSCQAEACSPILERCSLAGRDFFDDCLRYPSADCLDPDQWVTECQRVDFSCPPQPGCRPTSCGPHWLVEGETLEVRVGCQTEAWLDGSQVAFEELPAGAGYDPSGAILTWTPERDQAAVYEVWGELTDSGERVLIRIGVADDFSDPANVPVVDRSSYSEEFGLPVLFIDATPPEEYARVTVTYRGHDYRPEAKLRGATSTRFPKNSYTLKFGDYELFQEPDLAGGFVDRKKVTVTSTFDDNSYLRQRLGYDLWSRLDPEHILIRAYHAVVFLEGQYLGLYTLTDHVDRHLMAAHGLPDTGNLYKARDHYADFRVDSPVHRGLTKEEGEPEDDYSDLDELITFVDRSDDATFRTELEQRIDRHDYEDWLMFVWFTYAEDSAGKNAYHYHATPASVWRYVPWDLNASLGQSWITTRVEPERDDTFAEANRLFERLLSDPELAGPWRARFRDVLEGVFAEEAVLGLIDGYVAEISRGAERDWGKYAEQYRAFGLWSDRDDFTDFSQEVEYVRAWIRDRRWYLLELLAE